MKVEHGFKLGGSLLMFASLWYLLFLSYPFSQISKQNTGSYPAPPESNLPERQMSRRLAENPFRDPNLPLCDLGRLTPQAASAVSTRPPSEDVDARCQVRGIVYEFLGDDIAKVGDSLAGPQGPRGPKQEPDALTPTPPLFPTPEIEVTRVLTTPESTTPLATCTPLPSGMTLQIQPLGPTEAYIEMTGLQAGELLHLYFTTTTPAGNVSLETWPKAVQTDGDFSFRQSGLTALFGSSENRWVFKAIHARGVACAEVVLPVSNR